MTQFVYISSLQRVETSFRILGLFVSVLVRDHVLMSSVQFTLFNFPGLSKIREPPGSPFSHWPESKGSTDVSRTLPGLISVPAPLFSLDRGHGQLPFFSFVAQISRMFPLSFYPPRGVSRPSLYVKKGSSRLGCRHLGLLERTALHVSIVRCHGLELWMETLNECFENMGFCVAPLIKGQDCPSE
jgi:hypothetical protein